MDFEEPRSLGKMHRRPTLQSFGCSTPHPSTEQPLRALAARGAPPMICVVPSWTAAFHTQYLWTFLMFHGYEGILITQNENVKLPHFPCGAGSSLLCSSVFINPTLRGLLGTDAPKSPSLTRAASRTPLAGLAGVSTRPASCISTTTVCLLRV